MGKLVDFHSRNKLLLLSHSQKHYRLMRKLVSEGKKMQPAELYSRYEHLMMEALSLKTSIKKNINFKLDFRIRQRKMCKGFRAFVI